jgi:hypothetical protein
VTDLSLSPPSDAADASTALRADIRRLGDLLGQTLVRQEGQALLDLVEAVRAQVRADPGGAADALSSVDVSTGTKLARAFSTYFHLANITEQAHRSRELSRRRAAEGGWLDKAAREIAERGVPADDIAAAARRLAIRPVFTAHPTEAARRSILSKLRAIADELDAEAARAALFGSASGSGAHADRRLAELIDLLWQTDELRVDRPDPTDEARNAIYYLRDLYADISEAGRELADIVRLMPQRDEKGGPFFLIGTPFDKADAVVCGFPSEGSCLAAVALAIAALPFPANIVRRERGAIPTAVSQQKWRAARVTVYHFKVWDTQNDKYIVPERKSPLERIKLIGGEPMMETAERIQRSALDQYGRHSVNAESVQNISPTSLRASEIAKRHGLDGWTFAKPSRLGIDGVPRVAFTFRDGNEVHFDAGICRRLFIELTEAGEHEAAKAIDAVIKQLVGSQQR